MSSPSPNGKSRARDRKVAPGIYRTHYGWRIYVRVKGILRPKRITDPFHHLGLVELKQRREDWRTDARRRDPSPAPAAVSEPSTFESDVRDKYLPARRAMPGIEERRRHMALWIAEFGPRARATIQAWEIAVVRDRWLTEGPKRVCVKWKAGETRPDGCRSGQWIEVRAPLSARQVNNRLRALENLWTVLDGRHAYNPVREAGEAEEPEHLPRAIGYDVVEAILDKMPDRGRPTDGERDTVSLTKLRLRVLAYTGFSHGELMGITAADLHLDDTPPWVWVKGRRKGKRTKATAQPLTSQGAEALRALEAADALGHFSRDSMRASWRRACAKLNLVGIRPYDVRHSFATEVLAKTDGNLAVTQMLMRHKDPRTTLRYAAAAIAPIQLAALEQLKARGGFTSGTPKVTPPHESGKKWRK